MSGKPFKSPAEILATPVQFLRGVGPQRAELLAKLGVRTAAELAFFFPRAYEDMAELRNVPQLVDDQPAAIFGVVEEFDLRDTGQGKSVLGVLIKQGAYYLRAIWFNQPHLLRQFARGRRVLLMGSAKRNGGRWEMVHPKYEFFEAGEEPPAGRILPVYPLTEGLSQGSLRAMVQSALDACLPVLDEVFPDDLLDACNIWPLKAALPQVHAPTDTQALEQARRRFIFQELFVLQLALALRKNRLTRQARALPLPATAKIDARIRRLIPFELTPGQNRAIGEIVADLARECPMNRLLQGDVGSGKTMVAAYALLTAVAHGQQAALMAPTEILARQHRQTLGRLLAQSRVRIGLLTGTLTGSEREQLLTRIKSGEVDLVIGTQAIIQAGVEFARLGLVVIDEQHKFGVRQRAQLKQAALAPHYLVMTATPIPRTVTMTQYGDLEVTTLRDAPPGRQPVHTYLADAAQRPAWWEFVRKRLREGRQAYVIAPLVEESEDRTAASATRLLAELQQGELADFRCDLVHGRLPADEKLRAMEDFRRGQTQVLVATSVVEVGVDVPNATLLTIDGGQYFGLAQLHQLRGRVARGSHPGYVCVFTGAENDDTRARLEAFAKTTDGFELAEIDFRLRGPGDLFGTRQHGLPPLRVADLTRDAGVLEDARRLAQQAVAADPELAAPRLALLRRQVLARYGEALELGDVG